MCVYLGITSRLNRNRGAWKEIPSIQPVSQMQFSALHADYAAIKKQLDQAECEVVYAPPQADLGRFIQGARAKVGP